MEKFDIIIAGVGGQGVLTLAAAISRAALLEGYDIKAAEIHGLAMRFGALDCHLRIGKKVWSPLVSQGGADLIITLEPAEALRACIYASEKTTFLFDTKPIISTAVHLAKEKYPSIKEITTMLRIFSQKIVPVDASETTKKLTGSPVAANSYLLGAAFGKGHLPLKKESLLAGLAEVVPPKALDINKKLFEMGATGKK